MPSGKMTLVSKKRSIKREVKTIVRNELNRLAEHKRHAVFSTAVSLLDYSSPLTVDFSAIAQGDGQTQRVGNDIMVDRIQLRYFLNRGDSLNRMRIMLVHWKDNGIPNVTDILNETSDASQALISEYKEDRDKSFSVLYDKNLIVQTDGTDNTNVQQFVKKFKNPLKLTYDGVGSLAHANSSLYMIAFADSGAIPHPALTYRVKVHYTDL